MVTAMLTPPGPEANYRYLISDAELEAAAEETALSYTFQTDAYYQCCY